MKLLVTGGRSYSDHKRLSDELNKLEDQLDEIAHGGAKGADTLAGTWAVGHGIPCRVFPADWERHGRAAGPIRNREMLQAFRPDRVLAFTGGVGTADMVSLAEAAGIPVEKHGVYVFVFGSNLAGRHGAGAALFARLHHGAKYWQGEGRQGASYGIATKDAQLKVRGIPEIGKSVQEFLAYAVKNPTDIFNVTRIGCGYAGYKDYEMAPLFKGHPANVILPDGWGVYV